MERIVDNAVKRAIVRAYFDGKTLVAIKDLFKVPYQETIKIVSDFMIRGVRYAWSRYVRVTKAFSLLGRIVSVIVIK